MSRAPKSQTHKEMAKPCSVPPADVYGHPPHTHTHTPPAVDSLKAVSLQIQLFLHRLVNPVSLIQLCTLNAAPLSLTTPPSCPAVYNNPTLCPTIFGKYTVFLGCYGFPSRKPRPIGFQLFCGSDCVHFFFIPLPPTPVRVKSLESMHGLDTTYCL